MKRKINPYAVYVGLALCAVFCEAIGAWGAFKLFGSGVVLGGLYLFVKIIRQRG